MPLSVLRGGFTAFGAGLAALLVAGALGAALSPRLLQGAGLVAARATARPWTLLTCAFVGAPATVWAAGRSGCGLLKKLLPTDRGRAGAAALSRVLPAN